MSDTSGTDENILGAPVSTRRTCEEAENLLRAVGVGDTRALETLYDAYLPLVFGIASRMVGPSDQAIETVVGAAFVAAWHAAPSYPGGHVGAWLGRITRNVASQALGRGASLSYEKLAATEFENLEEPFLGKLDGTAIRAALATLPPDERMLLEMGFFSTARSRTDGRRIRRIAGLSKESHSLRTHEISCGTARLAERLILALATAPTRPLNHAYITTLSEVSGTARQLRGSI